jgi:hypothetical protein
MVTIKKILIGLTACLFMTSCADEYQRELYSSYDLDTKEKIREYYFTRNDKVIILEEIYKGSVIDTLVFNKSNVSWLSIDSVHNWHMVIKETEKGYTYKTLRSQDDATLGCSLLNKNK